MRYHTQPLYLPEDDFRFLFAYFGPSLGLWRAAEVAVLREIRYEPPVLDLGAGDGLVMSRVLPCVAVGLDPDTPTLTRAAGLGLYERTIAQAMEQADLPPESLGCVVSNSVLEHVPMIDAALNAAARTLRPGGQLVFTCPTEHFSRWLALPGPGYAAGRNRHFQHLNLWPVEEWTLRLRRAGFEVECVRPYLRRNWVWFWDMLELLQMVSIQRGQRRVRLFGQVWQQLPPAWIGSLAHAAARLDLSAPPPGGGRLILARKV